MPYEAVEELRRLELASLDDMERQCDEALAANHVRVDHGQVIRIDGEPITDWKPILDAMTVKLRIKTQRMRLVPELEAVRRTEVTVHDGDSQLDREIAELLEGLAALEQGEAAVEAAGTPEPDHAGG